MNQTPSPETVIRRAINMALRQVRVMLPGRIESYDATRCEADVQLLVMESQPQADGSTVTLPLTVVPHCPVYFCGGGGSRLTFPVQRGDLCWVAFSSSSLDRVMALSSGDPIDPQDDRHHHITDGIALVGMQTQRTVSAANASATVLEGNDIRIGDTTGDALATKADIDALYTYIDKQFATTGTGHTHTLASGGTVTLTTVPTGVSGGGTSGAPTAVGTTKTRAK